MRSGSPSAEMTLVAHRGDAARFPENTLAAFEGAAQLGLRHVELDVQLSADRVPLVLHDETLARTHGLDVAVTRTAVSELSQLGVLAGGRRGPPVPTVDEWARWLAGQRAMQALVELKKESIRVHGRRAVLDALTPSLRGLRGRIHVISYDARILAMARDEGFAVGYVLPGLSRRYRFIAERLAPAILLADWQQIVHADRLWRGEWCWAAFEVASPSLAAPLAECGVHYLETMNPSAFLGCSGPWTL